MAEEENMSAGLFSQIEEYVDFGPELGLSLISISSSISSSIAISSSISSSIWSSILSSILSSISSSISI